MTWAKLDDQFFQHPKAIAAGPAACVLYVGALTYCNRFLTDGHIPASAVRTLVPGLRSVRPLAERLVKVGLWETTTDGWQVHDFLTWNERGADIKARREATRKRVAEWRRTHEQAPTNKAHQADGNAVTERVTERVTYAPPTPTPTPTPTKTASKASNLKLDAEPQPGETPFPLTPFLAHAGSDSDNGHGEQRQRTPRRPAPREFDDILAGVRRDNPDLPESDAGLRALAILKASL